MSVWRHPNASIYAYVIIPIIINIKGRINRLAAYRPATLKQ